jgi:hypothetical protein
MNRRQRLSKLEERYAKVEKVRTVAISVRWSEPGDAAEIPPSPGKPSAVRITLQRHDATRPTVGKWPGDEVESEREPAPVERGQRPRRPTNAEQAAALEVLRARARRGEYLGILPASEADGPRG